MMSSNIISRDLKMRISDVLKNVSNCEILRKNFKIFAKFQGNLKFNLNVTKLHIQYLHLRRMLDFKEEKAISNNIIYI